ncbi:hypothetical protein SeLEV6574_g08419, partial [Synchytrium endobioticum]
MSTDAPSFPSFSSFPSPFQATRPAVDDHDHDHDHDHAGSRKRTKDAHRKKHKHRKRLHKDRGRPPSPHPSPESLPIIIDTKGDQNNLLYAQESKNIPDYRRYGDAVLGADNLFVSHKDSKDKKTVVLLSTHSRHRDSYRERYEHFYRALREPPKPLNAAESLIVDPLWKVDDDFVPFQDDILLTTEALLSSDPQESFATPGVKDHGIALEKTADYSRRLRDDPYNLELWLEFADLQERPFRSKGIRRSTLVERKLSIVEKALSHMPNEESLLLAYLDCIQEIPWESKDILAKWDDVLANNKLSVKLWDKYITFRMTNDTAFSVTDCIHVFEDCIKTLNDELDSDRGATEQLLAHNLTRVCYFLAQSGYTERAIACFQAMLEMTCFPPEAVTNASFTQMMLSFEDFWESEVPRVGDEGAKGWKFTNIRDAPPPRSKGNEMDVDLVEETWIATERSEERQSWLPLRDVSDAQDVERVVFFKDIQSLLFNSTLATTKSDILYSCLNFLGVPVNNYGSNDPV